MPLKREAVIPSPTQSKDEVLVVFKNDEGQLRNELIKDPAVAALYGAHTKKLDDLAAEYSQKRQAIINERTAIDEQAFTKAEKVVSDRAEAERKAREKSAPAE